MGNTKNIEAFWETERQLIGPPISNWYTGIPYRWTMNLRNTSTFELASPSCDNTMVSNT